MKKLISLIPTEGKTREQIVKETWKAYEKYRDVDKKVEKDKIPDEYAK